MKNIFIGSIFHQHCQKEVQPTKLTRSLAKYLLDSEDQNHEIVWIVSSYHWYHVSVFVILHSGSTKEPFLDLAVSASTYALRLLYTTRSWKCFRGSGQTNNRQTDRGTSLQEADKYNFGYILIAAKVFLTRSLCCNHFYSTSSAFNIFNFQSVHCYLPFHNFLLFPFVHCWQLIKKWLWGNSPPELDSPR